MLRDVTLPKQRSGGCLCCLPIGGEALLAAQVSRESATSEPRRESAATIRVKEQNPKRLPAAVRNSEATLPSGAQCRCDPKQLKLSPRFTRFARIAGKTSRRHRPPHDRSLCKASAKIFWLSGSSCSTLDCSNARVETDAFRYARAGISINRCLIRF